MNQSKHDDLNLAEVKAVLGRLQQISRKRSGAGAPAAKGGAAVPGAPPPAPADGGSSGRPAGTAFVSYVMNGPAHVRATALIVVLLAFFSGLALFVSVGRPVPVKEPPAVREQPSAGEPATVAARGNPPPAAAPAQEVQKPPQRAATTEAASELMASGQVRAAREVLLRIVQDGSADVAWALARSYDPNYLVTIRGADAKPDVAEATRWYRTWFDIAVKQGLVADSVSLDRIIRSMNELNR
jgi:hypothetical protein